MGLFGQNSPFDADIDKATSEKNTAEPWNLIMDICDKITSNPKNGKECLRSILRRMAHADPHVVLQAITLLDACVKNCGKPFHLEVASREFETEFKKLLVKASPPVATKMRQMIKKWKDNEFKTDPQLALIPSFYQKLKIEGHDFSEQKAPKQSAAQVAALKDPNVVSSAQEEEDIAKAIELSLKEVKNSPKKQTASTNSSSAYPSLYPSFNAGSPGKANSAAAAASNVEPRKVRALYDFEAVEENELTFFKGEIIHVLDDSDQNWWKGYNQRGQGLFPSNFVTADLSVEPDQLEQKSKKVQFEDEAASANKLKDDKTELLASELENLTIQPEINEEKIDRLLHLLHEANPEDPSKDTSEMLRLEEEVNQMGPLIDAELELVDRRHAQLTQLSSDLVDAINLYHTLMREPPISSNAHMNFYGNPGLPPPGNMYNQAIPPNQIFNPVSQQMGMNSYGMQPPLYHLQGNIAPNQMMQYPMIQGQPPIPQQNLGVSAIGPNMPPPHNQQNLQSNISSNPQALTNNLPGVMYENANMNNQQIQQSNQLNMSQFPNDNMQGNNIQNVQVLQSLQTMQQLGPQTNQQIPNTQIGGQQPSYVQGNQQSLGHHPQQLPPQQQQQIISGAGLQNNNLLQQVHPQNQQIPQLPGSGGIIHQGQHHQLINNSVSLQGNSLINNSIQGNQTQQHQNNGLSNLPISTLNHINSNLNNSMISTTQIQQQQQSIQPNSINSTLQHITPNMAQYPIAINQPINQNMLIQNDGTKNIPIYQQR